MINRFSPVLPIGWRLPEGSFLVVYIPSYTRGLWSEISRVKWRVVNTFFCWQRFFWICTWPPWTRALYHPGHREYKTLQVHKRGSHPLDPSTLLTPVPPPPKQQQCRTTLTPISPGVIRATLTSFVVTLIRWTTSSPRELRPSQLPRCQLEYISSSTGGDEWYLQPPPEDGVPHQLYSGAKAVRGLNSLTTPPSPSHPHRGCKSDPLIEGDAPWSLARTAAASASHRARTSTSPPGATRGCWYVQRRRARSGTV